MGTRMSLLFLMLISSLLCLQSRAESAGSVVFIDSSAHEYIKDQQLDASGEINSMSMDEVAATVSVLLGFAPSTSLSADSSHKLNEVLLPNPFDRPHAVFMLELTGVKDLVLSLGSLNKIEGSFFTSKILGPGKSTLELPGEDEVSFVPLDGSLEIGSDDAYIDEELSNLAKWLGGSYFGTSKSQDGKLALPLASGGTLSLHLAKKADFHFALDLASLVKNVKMAINTHEDLAGSGANPSEIMAGRFNGIQALKEEYGEDIIVQQGIELLQTAIVKLYDLLQVTYKGKIVVAVISQDESSSNSEKMLDVTFPARLSRWLEEKEVHQINPSIIGVLLVRQILAWITGVILLVSTILGVVFLINMPLTRDTLLYSNVKLD